MVRIIKINVVFERHRSEEFLVKVKEDDVVKILRSELSKLCGIPVHRLGIVEIFNKMIYVIYFDEAKVSRMKEHETIFAFELSSIDVKSEEFIDHRLDRTMTPYAEIPPVCKEYKEVSYNTDFGPKKIEEYTIYISPCPIFLFSPNGRFSAKELYDRCFFEMRKYVTEKGREELLKLGINLSTSNRASIFPCPTREQEERFIAKNFEEEIEDNKNKLKEKKEVKDFQKEKKNVFFRIRMYTQGMNYHSSRISNKLMNLYYTEHQPAKVKVRRLIPYYGYDSPSRGRLWMKMEMIVEQSHLGFFDFLNPHFEFDNLVDDDLKERLDDFFENVGKYCVPGSMLSVHIISKHSVVCENVPKFLFL